MVFYTIFMRVWGRFKASDCRKGTRDAVTRPPYSIAAHIYAVSPNSFGEKTGHLCSSTPALMEF
eukprot:SAG31_NODE_13796_length_846_cov_1.492637_1_plen_63_part_10